MPWRILVLVIPLLLWLDPALPQDTVSLTILHTNDTHSHLLPFSYPSSVPPDSQFAPLQTRTRIGGIARRATLANRLRAELSRQGTEVWLVDTGDFFEGTPFSIEYAGAADAAAMNAAGYTFGALGNHEFNLPLAQLQSLLRLFQYPVLCANAVHASTHTPLTRAYVLRKVGPLTIAIFGLLTRSTAGYPAAREGVAIAGEIETARRLTRQLRRQADSIILLSHCGDAMDQRLAASVPGIDVIVGGHSHSRLPFGRVVGPAPQGKARDREGTILVQAHQWGGELGRLDLSYAKNADGAWHLARHKAALLAVTSSIPEDAAVAAVVDRYWQPIAARYAEVLGTASADFIEAGPDLPAYNLMADAIRDAEHTDLVLENIGGVRAPLLRGKITRADLASLDPFDNSLVTFSIRGAQLRKILLRQKPAVSGLRYRIAHGLLAEATIGGKPLEDSRQYSGATNSYFARKILQGIRFKDTGKRRRDVLIDYVRRQGTVHPLYDARRVVVNGTTATAAE